MVATDPCDSRRARACSWPRLRRRSRTGFTLLEMLVVVAIVGIFAGMIGYGLLRDMGRSTIGLQASQTALLGLVTQARSQAVSLGRDVALLVHVDQRMPERYLRYIVTAEVPEGTSPWNPIAAGSFLPPGVYVVPPVGSGVSPLFDVPSQWSNFRSTALRDPVSAAIEASTESTWMRITFTPIGTTSAGQIVLANGISRPTSSDDPIPFVFSSVEAVRGLELSGYGQARLVNERSGFLSNQTTQ